MLTGRTEMSVEVGVALRAMIVRNPGQRVQSSLVVVVAFRARLDFAGRSVVGRAGVALLAGEVEPPAASVEQRRGEIVPGMGSVTGGAIRIPGGVRAGERAVGVAVVRAGPAEP